MFLLRALAGDVYGALIKARPQLAIGSADDPGRMPSGPVPMRVADAARKV